MRLLHSADWHLGKIFYGRRLTEDQAYLLDQFIDLARDAEVDAVLLAGDIFDRSVPPIEAVRLLDDVLSRLILQVEIPVIMISGNHDGRERLAFGAGILLERGLHIATDPTVLPRPITLHDAHGEVSVYPLPYHDPAAVAPLFPEAEIRSHQQAMEALIGYIENEAGAGPPGSGRPRMVVLSHCLVAGAEESESERPLVIGGSAALGSHVFEGFAYAAVGHLHRPQSRAPAHYPGSLMAYSFTEAAYQHSVNIVHLDAAGTATVEQIRLEPQHPLRIIEGSFQELLRGPGTHGAMSVGREDYILARMNDRAPVFEAARRLQQVYPNLLHIERPGFESQTRPLQGPAARGLDDMEILRRFFKDAGDHTLTAEDETVLTGVLDSLRREE